MRNVPPKVRPSSSMAVARVPRPRLTKTTRVAVLFADLRGYTGLAEKLAPAQIVPLLDEFFAVLAAATVLHGGQVFHVAGDGMMAGFGVGASEEEGARAALAAGHSMLHDFSTLAERWRLDYSIDTGIGIGLHTGIVALGLMGPPGRRHTTLVGDTVNVAARLCGRARAGEVLLSCTVAAALDTKTTRGDENVRPVAFLHLPQFELRGRTAPLDIWCVPAQERVTLS
jgi:adenylate cyclase